MPLIDACMRRNRSLRNASTEYVDRLPIAADAAAGESPPAFGAVQAGHPPPSPSLGARRGGEGALGIMSTQSHSIASVLSSVSASGAGPIKRLTTQNLGRHPLSGVSDADPIVAPLGRWGEFQCVGSQRLVRTGVRRSACDQCNHNSDRDEPHFVIPISRWSHSQVAPLR
jgi:hypothetical protein